MHTGPSDHGQLTSSLLQPAGRLMYNRQEIAVGQAKLNFRKHLCEFESSVKTVHERDLAQSQN